MVVIAILTIACNGGTPTTGSASTSAPTTATATATAMPETAYPPSALAGGDHFYLGVNLQWGEDSPEAYEARTDLAVEVLVNFFAFPFSDSDRTNLDDLFEEARKARAIPLITLEPHEGLEAVTRADVEAFADALGAVNAAGMPVFVRFAHEMNGSWYAWGQQPDGYVEAFRIVAAAVHAGAPASAMVWAPNEGAGYPFIGGAFGAAPGSPEAAALDTDGDGELTRSDDPYAPYYPGDDAVDWVGMSLYHWGNTHP